MKNNAKSIFCHTFLEFFLIGELTIKNLIICFNMKWKDGANY